AGRHAALVGELEALVAEHPLRERFRGQLMLALYRSGRQAEALDAYQVGRRLLSDELGLEPGESLKSRQRAMRAHDASLNLAVERHGGTLESLAGDCVTAVFGIPTVHEDDTLRAVRMAAEAREHLTASSDELASHWGARFELRIGVSTGEVIAGGEAGHHPHA